MRCMAKMGLALVVFMIAVGLQFAQGRPECGTVALNGVCFNSDNGNRVFMGHIDIDGDAALIWWDSNDFLQWRPDGSVVAIGTDTDVELWVCPATAGGAACIFDYWFTGIRSPGLLLGSGKFSSAGVLKPDLSDASCPFNFHQSGTVSDSAGVEYSVTDTWIKLKDSGSDGCRTLYDDIAISLAK